jgi:hypothetical protein
MAFTLVGIQYPSNWLLLSTEQDRSQRNITGPLPEPPWYDQQFYLDLMLMGTLFQRITADWSAFTAATAV